MQRIGCRLAMLELPLERRHPRDRLLAVHEQHPGSTLGGLVHQPLGLALLALAEGDVLEPRLEAHLLCEGEEQLLAWVERVGRDHEHEWRHIGRALEARRQVQWWLLSVSGTQAGLHKLSQAVEELLGTHAAQHHQPLKCGQACPKACVPQRERISRVVVLAPLLGAGADRRREARKRGQSREGAEPRPNQRGEPRRRHDGWALRQRGPRRARDEDAPLVFCADRREGVMDAHEHSE